MSTPLSPVLETLTRTVHDAIIAAITPTSTNTDVMDAAVVLLSQALFLVRSSPHHVDQLDRVWMAMLADVRK